jgi:putative FmdB family regulatory protein
MPFYEYECPKCGFHDEVLQSINEKPLTKCPNCGKSGLKKLMSAPVFRLKGSGWYVTDFRGGNSTGAPAPKTDGGDSKPADTGAAAPASTAAAPAPGLNAPVRTASFTLAW